jgi:hypothetical protein
MIITWERHIRQGFHISFRSFGSQTIECLMYCKKNSVQQYVNFHANGENICVACCDVCLASVRKYLGSCGIFDNREPLSGFIQAYDLTIRTCLYEHIGRCNVPFAGLYRDIRECYAVSSVLALGMSLLTCIFYGFNPWTFLYMFMVWAIGCFIVSQICAALPRHIVIRGTHAVLDRLHIGWIRMCCYFIQCVLVFLVSMTFR